MALTTAEVAAELARHDELRFHAPEHLDAYLRQLHTWRVVERNEQHRVDYASLEEYYRGRVTWDLTDAAVQVSRFLETFTPDGDRPGLLGPERLCHVHGELAALAELVDDPAPAAGRAPQAFTNLGAAVDALRAGVMAFMATLQAARSAAARSTRRLRRLPQRRHRASRGLPRRPAALLAAPRRACSAHDGCWVSQDAPPSELAAQGEVLTP